MGLQAQMAYTFSKSFDQASSFEGELNPLDFHRSYSLSQFDARHRLVLSYVWQLPIPKYSGFAGKVLNGWDLSGIYTYQTGFPIRITSSADNELMYSAFFEYPGEPDQVTPFKSGRTTTADGSFTISMRATFSEDNDLRTHRQCAVAPLLRSVRSTTSTLHCTRCCLWGRDKRFEFRAEFFNLFNHTQFNNPDGNITDGSDFGRIIRAKEPRLIQLALKFYF